MSGNIVTMPETKQSPAWYQDKQKLSIIKKTISNRELSDLQFTFFLELCKLHNLNPFTKQITVIPQGERVIPFVTIDGLWAIAQRSGKLNGVQSGVRLEGKELVGWCKIWLKEWEYPIETEAYLAEFFKKGKNAESAWEKMPRYMIKKVAEAHALRRAFPEDLSGLYAEEERWDDEPEKPQTKVVEPNGYTVNDAPSTKKNGKPKETQPEKKSEKTLTENEKKEIKALVEIIGINRQEYDIFRKECTERGMEQLPALILWRDETAMKIEEVYNNYHISEEGKEMYENDFPKLKERLHRLEVDFCGKPEGSLF